MIKPFLDRILVKPMVESFSPGGIALLQTKDDGLVKEIVYSEIVAVGPGGFNGKGQRESMWGLKAGDVVGHSPVGKQPAPDGMFFIRRDAVIGICDRREAA
jgi:co-chaperonin GroES (HSP10)